MGTCRAQRQSLGVSYDSGRGEYSTVNFTYDRVHSNTVSRISDQDGHECCVFYDGQKNLTKGQTTLEH